MHNSKEENQNYKVFAKIPTVVPPIWHQPECSVKFGRGWNSSTLSWFRSGECSIAWRRGQLSVGRRHSPLWLTSWNAADHKPVWFWKVKGACLPFLKTETLCWSHTLDMCADLLIDKALCPSDEEHLLRSLNGVMVRNWFFSQVARSSWKAFFCGKGGGDKIQGTSVQTEVHRTEKMAHFSSQADGSLREVLSLPRKVSLLLLEKPPLLFESLLLLQRVAVVKERRRLVVKGWVQLLLGRINVNGCWR